MALVDIDKDPWISEYEACSKLHHEILDLLNKRSVELKTSETYVQLTNTTRIRLRQYDTEVQQLRVKLRELALSRTIYTICKETDVLLSLGELLRLTLEQINMNSDTKYNIIKHEIQNTIVRNCTLDEAERRERLLENLKTNIVHLQRRFNDRDMVTTVNRSKLLDTRGVPGKSEYANSSSWPMYTDNDTSESSQRTAAVVDNYSVEQLKEQRRQMLKDQDDGLDELAKTVARQKKIALKIENEVDVHNDIIDDICNKMERTTGGIQRETDNIEVITRKSSTWGYWLIIISLLIAIIVVIFL